MAELGPSSCLLEETSLGPKLPAPLGELLGTDYKYQEWKDKASCRKVLPPLGSPEPSVYSSAGGPGAD